MAELILVRHSISNPRPDAVSHEWELTDAGRQRCIPLAEQLASYQPAVIISSHEPKARATAQLVAEHLGLPLLQGEGLHEHLRHTVPYFDSVAEFRGRVADFFARPTEHIFGEESADEAYVRFAGGIENALATYPNQTVVVVTHGTVMSLFIARANGLDAYALWERWDMPAYAVLSRPDFELHETVESVS